MKHSQTRIVTYWPPFNGGLPSEPVQICARWEEVVVGSNGLEGVDEVVVSLDVEDDGFLLAGTSTVLDPRQIPGVRRVHSCSKIPDLRSLKTLRVAVLS